MEDWRSFKKLCIEALLLEPEDSSMGGLMGYRRPSQFTDVVQARGALSKHPIFCWLSKEIPLAVNAEGDATFFVGVRRVRAVAEHLIFSFGLPLKPTRADKERKTAVSAAEKLLQCLNSGTLQLQSLARKEFLEELLEEAVRTLQHSQRQPRAHKFPWLRQLAIELHEQIGVADPKLLLQVAAVLSYSCDERTAQNYAKEALTSEREK